MTIYNHWETKVYQAMTETGLNLRNIERRTRTYSKHFTEYKLVDHLNDQFPTKEAPTIWKAQCDILEHHMSKIRNNKQDLAERVDKINMNILNSKDTSDMIEIMKIGLATYRHMEI